MAIAEPFPNVSTKLGTVPQVSEVLAISRSKIYQMMDAGELPFVKLGGSRRIRWSDVDELIRRSTVGGEK